MVAAVSAGGVIGALGRYAVVSAWPHAAGGFPWGTLLVNVSGCFLIGVLTAAVGRWWPGQRFIRPFLGTGVLGGYTTFSAWALETLQSRPGLAVAYAGATVVGALLAAWAGLAVVRTR